MFHEFGHSRKPIRTLYHIIEIIKKVKINKIAFQFKIK